MASNLAVFYDTWAYVAMADRSNHSAHRAASFTNRELLMGGYRPVTTNYIVDESATLVKRRLGHAAALRFLDDLESGIAADLVQFEWISQEREDHATQIFRRYHDKPGLSFTDCTNLVVMKEMQVSLIFTADQEFATVDPKNFPFRCLVHQRKGKYIPRL